MNIFEMCEDINPRMVTPLPLAAFPLAPILIWSIFFIVGHACETMHKADNFGAIY